MKKRLFFLPLLLVSTALSACGSSSDPYAPKDPGDGYVDALPESLNDGVFLQAFDWTFNQIKDNLGAIKDAGFKGVQTSPVQTPKSGGAVWYFFYQPVSFTIAEKSPLGTKQELIDLCTEADKYGIDIVVDVVFNHMATTGGKDSQGLAIVDPEVGQYEPEIYNHQDLYFHHSPNGSVTQFYSGLPDLNTGNEYVQERALSFLKECIDAGVDGFRFDAAKHIETPEDVNTPSDFWPNTLGVAKEYYKEKFNGKELFAYGEILNDLDGGRKNLSSYTKYMKVTDNGYIGNVTAGTSSDASKIVSAQYTKNTTPENLVTWVESHDTYIEEKSSHSTEKKLAKNWAVVASRKDTVPMFFARCDDKQTIGKIFSYDFENDLFGAANRFHNRFVGAEEFLSSDGNVFVNERTSATDGGALLVNVRASQGLKVSVKLPHLSDGYYFDQITNRQFEVKNHKATVYFHETGVAVLTRSNNSHRPTITNENRSCTFMNDFKTKITVTNAETAYYKINDEQPVNFSKSVTVNVNKSMTLTVYAENGNLNVTRIYNYNKIEIIPGYFNIINLNPSYISDYELYLWTWTGSQSTYSHDYTWNSEKGILLISNAERWTGFLMAIFAKGTTVSGNTWKNPIKQSGDIDPQDGFYDASTF